MVISGFNWLLVTITPPTDPDVNSSLFPVVVTVLLNASQFLGCQNKKRTGSKGSTVSKQAPEPPWLKRVQCAYSVLCTVCLMLKGLNLQSWNQPLVLASWGSIPPRADTTLSAALAFAWRKRGEKMGFQFLMSTVFLFFLSSLSSSRYFLNFNHFLSTVSSPEGTPSTAAEIEQGGFVL